MIRRQEFPKKIKLAAFQRSLGSCEECHARLTPGKFEYDHIKEATFNGEPTLDNCRVVCTPCHTRKTSQRAAVIAKSNRQRAKHLGIKRKGRKIPGSKGSGFRRRFDGTVWKESR